MGKKSREKRERKERIRLGLEQPSDKERQKTEQKQAINSAVLENLKAQWKQAVQKQYEAEPDKVRNTDIDKNTDDIFSSFQVKMIMKAQGIKREDIHRVLTEIKDEVCVGD